MTSSASTIPRFQAWPTHTWKDIRAYEPTVLSFPSWLTHKCKNMKSSDSTIFRKHSNHIHTHTHVRVWEHLSPRSLVFKRSHHTKVSISHDQNHLSLLCERVELHLQKRSFLFVLCCGWGIVGMKKDARLMGFGEGWAHMNVRLLNSLRCVCQHSRQSLHTKAATGTHWTIKSGSWNSLENRSKTYVFYCRKWSALHWDPNENAPTTIIHCKTHAIWKVKNVKPQKSECNFSSLSGRPQRNGHLGSSRAEPGRRRLYI